MRTGICSIHLQALTQEAATLVKQAVNLATRRGHSQVTPLHVASVMLSTSTSLLYKACFQCHSHPLQYKALELCFNVSLNRLPASTSSTLLGGTQYSTTPSLSNALVAAFKRAQANQRRGSSIENQQQSILALKIEVEQLILSILDDPSISRVMREAGFSSTLVKSKVEKAVSKEVCSQLAPSSKSKENTKTQVLGGSFSKSIINHFNNDIDDVTRVLSELVTKRRNIVIVGESLGSAEEVAKGVMQRIERGNFQGELKYVQFVSLPLVSFRNIRKEEVERKLVELRSLVKSYVGRGFVLYMGDLKWLFEFWSNYCEERRNYYCSVEHVVMEIKKLISGNGENGRFWLMGIASFKAYMKCKMCHPSLETIWELHPFTTSAGGLSLNLSLDSDFQAKERSKIIYKDEYFEVGAKKDCTTSLPTWLQNCKEERDHLIHNQENAKEWDICKKWNTFCSSVHGNPSNIEKQFLHISSSPSSPTSVSSHRNSSFHLSHQKELSKECVLYTDSVDDDCYEGNLIMFMPKPDLLSNPNSSPNSASSSEEVDGLDSTEMFKELNNENMKILCDALEKKVQEKREIIKEIASTVLLCRSGMRKGDNYLMKRDGKQETWMFFLGLDSHSHAKESISRELAKVVFGSYNNFISIGMSSFSSDKYKNKRQRDEFGSSYIQRFGEAVNENPHRVFFMEDFEQVDHFSHKGIKKAIQKGSITLPCAESVPLKDAIVIFSCENSYSSATTSLSDANIVKENVDNCEEKTSCLSLDLNIAIEVDAKNVCLSGDLEILELVDKLIYF